MKPLAEQLRPQSLDEVIGQEHLTKGDGALRLMVESKNLSSFILWGPSGVGKTTIAKLIANDSAYHFEIISAVFSGVKDLKLLFEQAIARKPQQTILFVDEIHRFNRSQQDSFLPVVEDGTIILIGATTENPSFELNSALLSRMQVFSLNRLSNDSLDGILNNALLTLDKVDLLAEDAKNMLVDLAQNDGRYLLNMLEQVISLHKGDAKVEATKLLQYVQKRRPVYDKSRDEHHNLISAFHKSIRASDVQAALFWFARMIDAGEDFNYIARRLTRAAVEDIGLADPNALVQAISAWQAVERLGEGEGMLALNQAVIYCASAPKSNANYLAEKKLKSFMKKASNLNPPKHILNAPTKLMKDNDYGNGYKYDHDYPYAFSGQDCLPEAIRDEVFYEPTNFGYEKEITKRLGFWKKLKDKITGKSV